METPKPANRIPGEVAGGGCVFSVGSAAELLVSFESAETFFLLADAVGDGFDAGAEVTDLCGET